MAITGIGPWHPDKADTSSSVSASILNVTIRADADLGVAYGPMQDISVPATATALSGGAPLGGVDVVSRAGVHTLVVGTGSTLEKYGTDGAWTSLGTGYAVPTGDKWSMLSFGSVLLATNTFDGLQSYNVELGGAVTLVANSYFPRILFQAFNCVFGGDCLDKNGNRDNRLLRNTALDQETVWTSGIGGAGYQIMPDGEEIVGGAELSDSFAVVFQRKAIRGLTANGASTIYNMATLAHGVGAVNPFCIAAIGGIAYFIDTDGIKAVSGSGVVSIGDQKVNRTFINKLIGTGGLKTVQAAIDPSRQLIVWGYQGYNNASDTVFQDEIAYSYTLNEFVPFSITAAALYNVASPGYDMDSMGTLYPDMDDPAMPDMDSRLWAGGEPGLFAIDADNKGGFVNGMNLGATLETATLPLTSSGLVTSLRLITDSVNATVAIATREQLSDPKVYGPEEVITEGRVMTLARGNYLSARITLPSGEAWSYCRGIDDVHIRPGGTR